MSLRRHALGLGVIALWTVPLAAQRDTAWTAPGPLLRGRDLATAGAFTALSAALMPADERIARWMRRPALQRPAGLQRTATVLRWLGSPGALGIGVGTYGIGVLAHDRTTADIGLHATGAIAIGSVVDGVLKGTIGRARPFAVADSDAHDYRFGRGFRRGHAYQSLPSGHATASFALATVLSQETRHRWPSTGRVAGPAAYGVATLVALSRLYNDDHWASDVALGAGIGTVSGLAVVRYAHAHPDNAVDRHLLPATAHGAAASRPRAMRGSRPITLAWSVRF